jgi:hypothetical protein
LTIRTKLPIILLKEEVVMRILGIIFLIAAALAFIAAMVARLSLSPLQILPAGVEPKTLLGVTKVFLLASIALTLLAKK